MVFTTTTTIESIDRHCYLLRNALDERQQMEIFQDILERSKQIDDTTSKTCMNPTPKTIIFDGHQSTLRFKLGKQETSVYGRFIQKISALLSGYSDMNTSMMERIENCNHLSMGAIRYPVPDGAFPEHIDHCNDSYVFLLSIGCSANFVVRGPAMQEKYVFAFHSGDVLVFDASTQAAIVHGVKNIHPDSCPTELAKTFPILQNHRYGIQCRIRHHQS